MEGERMNEFEIKKNGIKVFAVFLLLQIQILIWREMVLGIHGFPQFVFSVSVGSIIGSLVISAAVVFLDAFDEQLCKGIIWAVLWNIISCSACIYIIKTQTDVSMVAGVILFLGFVTMMVIIWVLIQKKIQTCKPKAWVAITSICCLLAVLLFFFCKLAVIQTVFINVLLTVVLYASLLCDQPKHVLKYAGIIICAMFFTINASYQLGQYGKSTMMHEGKEYKVLVMDADYYYCEEAGEALLVPNIHGMD